MSKGKGKEASFWCATVSAISLDPLLLSDVKLDIKYLCTKYKMKHNENIKFQMKDKIFY